MFSNYVGLKILYNSDDGVRRQKAKFQGTDSKN